MSPLAAEEMMIWSPSMPVRPGSWSCGSFNKFGGKEAKMTEIDLVDWTIQEAQHLKAERREPINVNDKSSLDNVLAVFEPEP
jgi:hypothetical protein